MKALPNHAPTIYVGTSVKLAIDLEKILNTFEETFSFHDKFLKIKRTGNVYYEIKAIKRINRPNSTYTAFPFLMFHFRHNGEQYIP